MATTHERRMEIEALILKHTIASFLAAGFSLSVFDGESTPVKKSTDAEAIFAALRSTDDDYLRAFDSDEDYRGFIHFVYGNEGNTVISDNSTRLEQFLTSTTAYAESFDAELYT